MSALNSSFHASPAIFSADMRDPVLEDSPTQQVLDREGAGEYSLWSGRQIYVQTPPILLQQRLPTPPTLLQSRLPLCPIQSNTECLHPGALSTRVLSQSPDKPTTIARALFGDEENSVQLTPNTKRELFSEAHAAFSLIALQKMKEQAFPPPLAGKMSPGYSSVASTPQSTPGSSPQKPFSSPAASNPLKAVQVTPPEVRQAVHAITSKVIDPACSLMPSEQTVLDNAEVAIDEKDTPERYRLSQRLFDALCGPDGAPKSPEQHQTVWGTFNGSDWIPDSLGRLRRLCESRKTPLTARARLDFSIPEVVNMKHITNRENGLGFHWCPSTHDLAGALKNKVVHNQSGVYAASFPSSAIPSSTVGAASAEKEKYSTFFPDSIQSEIDLLYCIKNAEPICGGATRVFCRMSHQGSVFFGVKFHRKEVVMVNSCFPVFHFTQIEDHEIFDIGGIEFVKKDQLTALAQKKISDAKAGLKIEAIDFEDDTRVIIDLAAYLAIPGILKGIYISFPKTALKIDSVI